MMRTRQRKFSIALLFIACSLSVALATPAHDFERKITEEYSISENGSVEMHNRYGNVDVETWSGSEVKIEVIITVDARNQEKADEVFDRIDINFSNSASEIGYLMTYLIFSPLLVRLFVQ